MAAKKWFGGKVTLERQLTGLAFLPLWLPGSKVLDVGCAEGDIGEQCLRWGAAKVHGIDISPTYAKAAALRLSRVTVADIASWPFSSAVDVVLALGVLNKIENPGDVLARMLATCRKVCVLRLSGGQWPMLATGSVPVPVDLWAIAARAGFQASHVCAGPSDPSTGDQVVVYLTR